MYHYGNQAQAVQAVPQNDVANFLTGLIALFTKLGFTGLVPLLTQLRDFFEHLNDPQVQALGECEAAFVANLRGELMTLLARIPPHVQVYINCKLGVPSMSLVSAPQAGWGDLISLIPKLVELAKYLPQIIAFIKMLLDALPKNPTVPLPPAQPSDYSPRAVPRCG